MSVNSLSLIMIIERACITRLTCRANLRPCRDFTLAAGDASLAEGGDASGCTLAGSEEVSWCSYGGEAYRPESRSRVFAFRGPGTGRASGMSAKQRSGSAASASQRSGSVPCSSCTSVFGKRLVKKLQSVQNNRERNTVSSTNQFCLKS